MYVSRHVFTRLRSTINSHLRDASGVQLLNGWSSATSVQP